MKKEMDRPEGQRDAVRGGRGLKMTQAKRRKVSHGPASRFLSRQELADRWGCSIETLKRREKAGVLNGLRFSARMVRYSLEEVLRVEQDASCQFGVPMLEAMQAQPFERLPTMLPLSGFAASSVFASPAPASGNSSSGMVITSFTT